MSEIKSFIKKCGRVWKTLKKPNKQEFSMTAKISAIGILILGAFGFLVSMAVELIQK